jgi:hypothetical protein
MIQVTLIGRDGRSATPEELLTADELHEAADKARALACKCELLLRVKLKEHQVQVRSVPYFT